MNNTSMNKPWYQSKTIWLAVAGAIGSVSLALGKLYPQMVIFNVLVSIAAIINRILQDNLTS